jgi:hypothetical protein
MGRKDYLNESKENSTMQNNVWNFRKVLGLHIITQVSRSDRVTQNVYQPIYQV